MLILGFLPPLVIHAQPFGDTEIVVYDGDFLPVPRGDVPFAVPEPPLPEWVALATLPVSSDTNPPPATMEPSL